jgi:hypothetical protein
LSADLAAASCVNSIRLRSVEEGVHLREQRGRLLGPGQRLDGLERGLDNDRVPGTVPDGGGAAGAGQTFAERGYMTPSFSKPTDLPDEVALVRVFIPAGSTRCIRRACPSSPATGRGADIIMRRGQRYRVIGRLEVNGREVLEVVLLPD